MSNKILYLIFIILLSVSISGCTKPSFPKEKVIEAVIDMCKKEYNVKVKSKIVGNTFGVYIPMGSLLSSSLGFKEDALEILQDVSTSVRRVCLSTNANFDFFIVIGADKSTNIEFVMTHSMSDLKQIMLGNISRGDYMQRMVLRIKYDMQSLGERRVKGFFSDLATARIEKIIGGNFYPGITLKDISSAFFLSLLELSMKTNIDFKILIIKSMPISSDDVLFYVKAKETYEPKPGYSANTFTNPSGFEHEYLFVVTGKDYLVGIKKIYPLNAVDTLDKSKIVFPKEFAQYQDISKWDEVNFYIDDMNMPLFLAGQIAQRIKNKINENAALKGKFAVDSIDGNYSVLKEGEKGKKDLQLILKVKDKGVLRKDMTKTIQKNFYDVSLAVFKQVCKDYKFKDFKKISIFDSDNKQIFSIDKSMLKMP